MSGPPYPRYAPIGSFVIGASAIGPAALFDVWATIISQYANSSILTTLITNFFDYIDQSADLDSFFDLIWNIDTAQGHGLDVWGRILDVTRTIAIPGGVDYMSFEETTDGQPFGGAPLFSGSPLTDNFLLTDTAYLTLLFVKALANISDGSVKSINQMLLNLFPGRGNCYVADGEDMSLVYTFDFALTPVEFAIVSQSGVMPTPVGVSATVSSL